MIEAVRTFFGKLRGEHGSRKTIVEQGTLWHCTKCKMVFVTREGAEGHAKYCNERI
jgi:hypothetical protein